MKILAFDTSGMSLCLGISDGEKRYEYRVELGRMLSQLLAPTIRRALDAACIPPRGLDVIAAGTGPGSFTSLRVGIAAAKGLAWANSVRMTGISSLDILAENAGAQRGSVIAVMDAKRGMVYACVYGVTRGTVHRKSPPMLLESRAFRATVRRYLPSRGNIVLCGDGIPALGGETCGARVLDRDYWCPRPESLLKLAEDRARRTETVNASDLQPVYLYPKECQIRKLVS